MIKENKELINRTNIIAFMHNGIFYNHYQCTNCGNIVTADKCISNKGNNLLCFNCAEKLYGSVDEALNYINQYL